MSPKKTEDAWIETLLAAHPAEVEDHGFSARVLERLEAQERRRYLILAPFYAAAVLLALVFFPSGFFTGFDQAAWGAYLELIPLLAPIGAGLLIFLFSWFSEEAA